METLSVREAATPRHTGREGAIVLQSNKSSFSIPAQSSGERRVTVTALSASRLSKWQRRPCFHLNQPIA